MIHDLIMRMSNEKIFLDFDKLSSIGLVSNNQMKGENLKKKSYTDGKALGPRNLDAKKVDENNNVSLVEYEKVEVTKNKKGKVISEQKVSEAGSPTGKKGGKGKSKKDKDLNTNPKKETKKEEPAKKSKKSRDGDWTAEEWAAWEAEEGWEDWEGDSKSKKSGKKNKSNKEQDYETEDTSKSGKMSKKDQAKSKSEAQPARGKVKEALKEEAEEEGGATVRT